MIRRSDNANLRLFLLEQFAEVSIPLWRVVGVVLNELCRFVIHRAVNITHCDHVDRSVGHGHLGNNLAPPTGADQRSAVFLASLRRMHGRRGQCYRHGSGCLQELSSCKRHSVFLYKGRYALFHIHDCPCVVNDC